MPSNINPELNKIWKKKKNNRVMFSFKCTKHLVDAKILKSGVMDQRKVKHSNERRVGGNKKLRQRWNTETPKQR